jgi:class 3 adenylate cyclase
MKDARANPIDDASISSETSGRSVKEIPNSKACKQSAPEELVQREDRALIFVKVIFLLVLVAAAGVTAGFIFSYTRDSQKRNFRSDFSLISQSIAESLVDDVAFYFESGQSVATALTVLMQAYNSTQTTFSIPASLYRSMTNSIITTAVFVTWNPFIRDDEEREEFEGMVAQRDSEGFFTEGDITPCFVCGEADMVPSTPNVELEFPGIGKYSCLALQRAGVEGLITAELCPIASQAVIESCSCTQSGATEETTKARRPSDGIFRLTRNKTVIDEPWTSGPYLPMWLDSTMIAGSDPVLFNHLSHPKSAKAVSSMLVSGYPQLTEMYNSSEPTYYSSYAARVTDPGNGPASNIYYPVRSPNGADIVGAVSLVISWQSLLRKTVPRHGEFVMVVVESSCGEIHSYKVKETGSNMIWLGNGDLHDTRYDRMMHQTSYEAFDTLRLSSVDTTERNDNKTQTETCDYRFSVYPTSDLEAQYISKEPWMLALCIVTIFVFTSLLFALYDYIVRRRQAKIMSAAKRTDDIVTSLFPETFRDRLYEQIHADLPHNGSSPATAMTSFLSGSAQGSVFGSGPIADFFPSCTVLFIDIANFTAWCSEREPSQVFILLENVYHTFDQVAEQLGIFKVETIGDSYVAVCGLPTPRNDHAVAMTRFACLCMSKMRRLVKDLEVSLGPSTGDLVARCGMHSGPVTAGVLRGTKARFQLFGDTVNTASRMESSGIPGQIHASEQTIALLTRANKCTWIVPREEEVHIKGKGMLKTFWLDPRRQRGRSAGSSSCGSLESLDRVPVSLDGISDVSENLALTKQAKNADLQRKQRLIEWNVEVLHDLLTRVVARRNAQNALGTRYTRKNSLNNCEMPTTASGTPASTKSIMDEMTEVITLPKFDLALVRESKQTTLPGLVRDQLRSYVSNIANSYRDVPFHNFEHASHVIMSATKLMKRIMSPEGLEFDQGEKLDEAERRQEAAHQIHKMTYGMSSDPLMQFSVVFSALIHDVDHTGLTNKELIDMKAPVAAAYNEKCVAEQNSVDVAWQLLMDREYEDLRQCIYANETEKRRFRELVVDAVLATDIADKELGTLRKGRWVQAFAETSSGHTADIDVDRKATIVFEHIIQASDVCHTMQHWRTYQKFNSRLFEERYIAYRKGVAGENPPWVGWYNGEIWFFDNYIIPLAQKLNDCGVFGVSYHEYLSYALENRAEWERKGREIVEKLRHDVETKYLGTEW